MRQTEIETLILAKCGAAGVPANNADAEAAIALAILHLSKTLKEKT